MHMISLLVLLPFYVAGQCGKVTIRSNEDVTMVKSCSMMGSLMISGDLKHVVLDSLQSVDAGIKITGTSSLTTVSLASLSTAEDIEVTNNSGLVTLSMPSISKLSGKLFISGNSPSLEVDTSKLSSVGDSVTFSNCTSIEVSSLSQIGNSASFTGSSFTQLNLTSLKMVSKDLSFSGNDRITVLTFPKLDTVGGTVLIANNTQLESVTFPTLTTIGGSLEVNGHIQKLIFDTLNDVRGSATIVSDAKKFQCTDLEAVHTVTQGKYGCDNGKPSSSSTSKATKPSNANSHATMASPYTVSLMSLTALLLIMFN